MEQLKYVPRETEPQLLNEILINLKISGRRLQGVEFIYLHEQLQKTKRNEDKISFWLSKPRVKQRLWRGYS